ncbi:hypothetical protein [Amycolatopsis sp. CA-230715]|uniref:hypothetical protein n=1 Tax=Amycolatopsis sp. CA-230715 TaxID=2745196 RepID=UPI001C0358DE|nr:hypothetical protein [Amycolatopsis sp. CA-230715]QWF82478.1 hypothetical protein HUW46_05915 [Amycolatopsis sp. CA-230715]
MRRLTALVATALLVLITAGTADAASKNWTTRYNGGSATGTAHYETAGPHPYDGKVHADGTLTVADSGCYFATMEVMHFPGAWISHQNSATRCGPGSIPVNLTEVVARGYWSGSVAVCQPAPNGGGWCDNWVDIYVDDK